MTTDNWLVPLCRTFAVELLTDEDRVLPVIHYGEDDPLVHTDESPFCSEEGCPCHYDGEMFDAVIGSPMMDGLLTSYEANALRWGENV